MLDQAIALASKEFLGRFDKGGAPYILHCLAVMHDVDHNDEELMIIAVLHDVVEDTNHTLHSLTMLGYSERIIRALDCLTHRPGEDYDVYVDRISTNLDAVKVKMADLRHNSDITRMKGLREKDFKRLEKYHRNYKKLEALL